MISKRLIKKTLALVLIISPLFTEAQNFCEFIGNIQTYQDSVKIIRKTRPAIIDSATFNIKTYWKFYDRLSIPYKMNLGCYYFDNFHGGKPYLYILEDSISFENFIDKQVPRSSIQDKEKYEHLKYEAMDKFLNDTLKRAKYQIIPEDSQEGYLQYLFFYYMGEQFALKWHSNYLEKYVICSNEAAKTVLKKYENNARFKTSTNLVKILTEIDPNIVITMDNNYCYITWVDIITHEGIFKRTYRINRSIPHKIKVTDFKVLVSIVPNFNY